jgi:hypothetical protein
VLHRIDDYAELEGHKFLRMAAMLPLYDGALRRRLEILQSEEEDKPKSKTMTMQEALAQAKGEPVQEDKDIRTLQKLDIDAQNPLFEYATG